MVLPSTAVIMSALLLAVSGVMEPRKRERGKKATTSNILFALGLIGLAFSLFFFYERSCRLEMQRRLNQPVSSVGQLYGYKILEKSYTTEKPSPEALVKTNYFVDLEDLIPPQRGILRNVEITEKVYNDERVKKGASFFPNDPNDPNNKDPS